MQRLTELHDGTVEARSEPGQGSEFTVRIPLQPDDSKRVANIEVAVPEANRALRVLVVDDNVDTVLGFSLLLKAQGHDVRTAYNGPDAVKTAAEFHPQVIMLDIGLPVLNGYEVAKQIRAQPEGEKIMLIALTGYGQDSDRRTSSDAGFDHHLVKPARFEQLLQILATVKVSE